MVLPPGVRTSTQAWPYQVNVVSRSRPIGDTSGVDATTPLHSGRGRHADRPEPRVRQLDGPDRPGVRIVRGGRPAPPADHGDARLPALHDHLRGRLRGPRLALRRCAAGLARELAGRGRSGLGRAPPRRPGPLLRPRRRRPGRRAVRAARGLGDPDGPAWPRPPPPWSSGRWPGATGRSGPSRCSCSSPSSAPRSAASSRR